MRISDETSCLAGDCRCGTENAGKAERRRRRLTGRLFAFLCCFLFLQGCGQAGKRDGSLQETAMETDTESDAGMQSAEQERSAGLDVWFFSCSEDADSILLQTEDANIMIDTGVPQDSRALVEKLRTLGVERIDLLILTHPDRDHIGGAAAVLNAFPVDSIMTTDCEKGSGLQDTLNERLRKENVSVPRETQEAVYGELCLTIYPPRETAYDNANNYSIAVLASYEGRTFFFAGDARKKRIRELLDEELPAADVYKAAHHGRDSGACVDLIEALQPQIAVVTAKEAEKKTTKALQQAGAAVYSTYGQDVHLTVVNGVLDAG